MKSALLSVIILYCFSSHSLECPPGHYVVKGHPRSSYVRSDGTVVNATIVKTHCKKMTLASEYLQKHFKKGIPKDWPHRTETSRSWTEADKNKAIEALEVLPDFLLSSGIEGFYRFKKSKDHPNPASHADGIIAIYDSGFANPNGLERILAHELMHQNYADLSEKEQQDYRRATGWRYDMESDGKFYWKGRDDGYIADDGKTSYEEDYANNLEHFLYEPDKLKKVTPSAYEWIKKKYGDKLKLKDMKK